MSHSAPQKTVSLQITQIVVDPRAQARPDGIDEKFVAQYVADLERGDRFPPIEVFRVDGKYVLAVGFHRFEAWKQFGADEIEVKVHEGTVDDAFMRNLESNLTHGKPLSKSQRREIATNLLERYPGKPDQWYADRAGIHRTTVLRIRRSLEQHQKADELPPDIEGELPPDREGVHCTLRIDQITAHPFARARSKIYSQLVDELIELMDLGFEPPPIVVFYDGETYWLGDGFHRYEAYKKRLIVEIDVIVKSGNKRDAFLENAFVNARQGLRISRDDRVNGALRFLRYDEYAKNSDDWFSDKFKLPLAEIATLRKQAGVQFTPNFN